MAMLSTREWLRLVVLVAFDMILFQGIWWIVIYPPVALVAMIINMGLACIWVRPGSLNRGILAAMGAGLGVVVGSLSYLADANFRARLAGAILASVARPDFQRAARCPAVSVGHPASRFRDHRCDRDRGDAGHRLARMAALAASPRLLRLLTMTLPTPCNHFFRPVDRDEPATLNSRRQRGKGWRGDVSTAPNLCPLGSPPRCPPERTLPSSHAAEARRPARFSLSPA